MSELLASLRDLTVTYAAEQGTHLALDGLDLDIVKGERLAVIGESGSGKSTLALALGGLLPPETHIEGSIGWPGFAAQPQPGLDIGFVFQDAGASLNPVIAVGRQITEIARLHLGLSRRKARERARALLARVRIPDPDTALAAFPHQLSGGQRQRVAIAAAIAAKPSLLIADEATSALDTIVQAEIVALLDELVRAEGMTLIFITHDIALASGFADRIVVLRDARLVETGPTAALLGAPKQAYTAKLLASHIGLDTPPLVAGEPA
ncbi:ABC transporter ATP-binding protein [Aquamicrobium terrae]|uniref:Peptide/nickel transport system ATP-binding protein n=1 Tax=Aquamicrobium terrae TaxID=1324945 RepID=A0ABV2N020_9HYPH